MRDEIHDRQASGERISRDRRRHHLGQILSVILADERFEDPRWKSLTVVFSSSAGGRNFANSGYAYGDGPDCWAVSFPVVQTRKPILEFLAEWYGEIPKSLCRVLLQYDQKTGRALVTPEIDNPEKWTITPDNANELALLLKPHFEDDA